MAIDARGDNPLGIPDIAMYPDDVIGCAGQDAA
jgi:hypothetical protein